MKHILVPTDFSDASIKAVEYAVKSAEMLPAKVTLMYAFAVSGDFYTDYMGVNREFNNSMIADAKKDLNNIKTKFQNSSNVEIDTLVSTEPLFEAVKTETENLKIDLIIMGTHGASGVKEKIWGSNTSEMIGKTTVPILAVPIDYKWKEPGEMLLATKEFEKDAKILNFIFELGHLYPANIHTAVFTNKQEDNVSTYLQNSVELEEYKDFLKEEYNEDIISASHLIGGSFEDSINKYVEEENIDILVMITYQNGFWKSLFSPSVTKKMSLHSNVPLLAIPAK